MSTLFSPTTLGSLTLQNALVMCPLTRNRAKENLANELMLEYYQQRASFGLIITEGSSPSPNGLGYPRIPGIFTKEQTLSWQPLTAAVHQGGAKLFMQLMHCGRIAHPNNLPLGARVVAPSAVAAAGEIYTDDEGLKPHPIPHAMSLDELSSTQAEYVAAAKNAISAGFDGVEIHAANGYLLEQFIRPNSNQRTDRYGGEIENRARFLLEIVELTIAAIGRERVGVRLSPYGVFNDMPLYDAMADDYTYLAQRLNQLSPIYIHLVDHTAMGAPEVPETMPQMFRAEFNGTLILSGGYDAASAEADLSAGKCDLIGVGRPALANPDLVKRWQIGAELNEPDPNTFYTPKAQGYLDYPTLPA
ncbi:alkene reductase [Ectothiorhodospiraceae bacterium BW-2]|nr:alkene reductase [Ectothiorhodospiraceae bacterium BW-2]